MNWISKFLPFLSWSSGVNAHTLRRDFIAGLTGAIVVLPQGVAFASIAGMPPEYGLYSGMIPAIVAALFGSSRHLVSGPTTAASIVLFSALNTYAEPATAEFVKLALTLTLMVGVIELVLGLARMGALVNFISHSVIVGFTAGAAMLIAAKQLGNFFGVATQRGGHFHDVLMYFTHQLNGINPYVTVVALVTLVSGVMFRTWFPRIPFLIGAMIVGSVFAMGLNAVFGAETTRIETLGTLPNSLPPLSSPMLSFEVIKNLAPAALAVTLFALTEAVSIGRSIGARSGQRIDGNQEFIGQGLSNIIGSFFSAYVATGSFNRSGLNYQAGARTPLGAVFAGALLILVVLLVAPLAAWLPNAAMAGILFLVAWGLIDFREIAHIVKASGRETAIMAATFFGALFLELEFAIFLGVILSLVLYLERVSKPRIFTRAPDPSRPKHAFASDPRLPQCPQLHFVRIDGSLFFGSIHRVEEAFARYQQTQPERRHLAILAKGINFADLSGADALAREAERRRAREGDLYLIDVKQGLRESLDRMKFIEKIGERNIFATKSAAITAIFQKLDKSICRDCTRRIFRECSSVEEQ